MVHIFFNNTPYELKFGMKLLNLLGDFLKNISDENAKTLFLLAIQDNHLLNLENITLYQEILHKEGLPFIKQKIIEAKEDALKGFDYFDKDIYEKLYQIAVGELNISPKDFEKMTPYEITLAYEGYLNKSQLQANITLITLRKSFSGQTTKISLLNENDYNVKTLKEREEVFRNLNI